MNILFMACPAGDGRASSPYVCPLYGAYSPDLKHSLKLPTILYNLWVVLTDHPGEVVSYLTLTRCFWPSATIADPDAVRVHLWRLRSALWPLGWRPEQFEAVRGRGVMFHPPPPRKIKRSLNEN